MKPSIRAMKFLLAALGSAGLLGATAFGAEVRLASHERGKIESVDTTANTLTIQKAHSQSTDVFTWNAETTFAQREHLVGKAQTVTASDLKPGEHVNIEYYKEGDHLVARKITISHENHAAVTATQWNQS